MKGLIFVYVVVLAPHLFCCEVGYDEMVSSMILFSKARVESLSLLHTHDKLVHCISLDERSPRT